MRNVVFGTFEDIESTLSDIELYDDMFPSDENVIEASTRLVVATLIAIENAIGFYSSYQGESMIWIL